MPRAVMSFHKDSLKRQNQDTGFASQVGERRQGAQPEELGTKKSQPEKVL